MSNRPIGPQVDPLPTGAAPDLRPLHGRWMRLDPISLAHHGVALWNSFAQQQDNLWTYMPYGPFDNEATFFDWLKLREAARDPWFYAFVKRDTGESLGMGAFMRLDAPNGAIEIGNIWMAPALQRTREATEAIYLMMRHCFDDLGVRRLEWKCDALNAPSRKAALRFGFEFEGIFRQHMIIKGRNRDTAWFAMIDKDWPMVRAGFEAWLDEGNFDGAGRQKSSLNTSFQITRSAALHSRLE
jgi:RimJ/RimL family protein N-acetyltransferase